VIADALGRGEQIVVLRKGGILEGPGGFGVEHSEFLLFPTLFHQQRASVVPAAQARYDQLVSDFPPPDVVRIEHCAKVVDWRQVTSLAAAQRLRGQHAWRDDVIARRFDWGRAQGIFALAVRVYQLPARVELPMRPAYAGCKSWIELEVDVDPRNARPVLDDATFAGKLDQFRAALSGVPADGLQA
jgi:hypothetical protein